MKERKNNLDERQEQALLKIEHNGCWLAFWGLLLAMFVQVVAFGYDFRTLAGEWIVFMVLCIYIGWDCMKHGIWDRRLRPDPKTNALVSAAAALAFGGLMFARVWKNYPDKPVGAAAAGVFIAVVIFVICFASLSISARQLKKRQEELEKETEDEDEDVEKA